MNTAESNVTGPEPEPEDPGADEPRNDGISLSGGPVTNTGAIVAGGDNRVTVRRTGAVRGTRDAGRGHPLTSTGALVSGSGHELEVEDTGDVEPADAAADPGEGRSPGERSTPDQP
ncbi:hypothetical protein B4N89_22760 [Embleya scabrispora]|uniref:Uncharacterized protein n=1 Tax=Embleya scabrispora TaxID=159449 RepID=A0A1T3P2R1_9ACTN|nr:hypothetical protein [Embleya scabrispora]OPC83386.1 hypothetical protein B4N89_22760 [Embleya scabrispora]